jgi:hypothetical protein
MPDIDSDSDSSVEEDDEESEHGVVANSPVTAVATMTLPTGFQGNQSRPPVMHRTIEGVTFINNHELLFVDKQRVRSPSITWFTDGHQEKVRPSRHWFGKDRLWLRAICTNNQYGLICVECAEFASNTTLIERNNGAFIARPYWKLKHKGLEGST